jgi:integrase
VATLSTINGRRIVQVVVRDHRRTVSLGRVVSERDARETAKRIQQLADAVNLALPVPLDVARWANGVHERLHRKLVKTGLVAARLPQESTKLGDYFDAYEKRRTDWKPSTRENWQQVANVAVGYFGRDRDLTTITRGEAKDWRRALEARYAGATVVMHVKKLRQLFADAVDRKLATENPFLSVAGGSQSNPARMYYVPRPVIQSVIEQCPDAQWRLLFALARYAGLRIPSEIKGMLWSDIDWSRDRFTVRSSKTEHHPGRATRVVPIFPELMKYLLEAQGASDGEESYVFPRMRIHENLSTQAQRIIEAAGVPTWPKMWQNLRSSCETDLAATQPLHLACTWIGNSTGIAMKHYLQVTDADFRRAAKVQASVTPEAQTVTGQQGAGNDEIIEKLRALLASLPPRGAEEIANTADSLQAAHRCLQDALHSADSYAANFRQKLIQNLQHAVEQAKARGGRR